MPDLRGRYIVETNWLAEHLSAPDLVVVDGSTHLPNTGRNARAEYEEEHIPGSLFFDINDIADTKSPLPHMLPTTVVFASKMKKMGIGDGTRVIAYDSQGLYSAARVWWMLRTMGHEDVAVLNGGLPKWKAEGHAVTDEDTAPRTERHFTPRFNAALVRDVDGRQIRDCVGRRTDRGRPVRRSLHGTGGGATRRSPVGPHARRQECPVHLASEREWHSEVGGRHARGVRGGGRRSCTTGHDHLWFRRNGRRCGVGVGIAGQSGRCGLRWIVE